MFCTHVRSYNLYVGTPSDHSSLSIWFFLCWDYMGCVSRACRFVDVGVLGVL